MTKRTLGLRQGTLAFTDWSGDWAQAFEAEAALIRSALPGLPFAIEHIGSTAVPGLLAKPVLDIGMTARDHDAVAAALTTLGYIDRGERSGRLFIRLRDGDVRTHNLHLYRPGSLELADQIAFRDRLRKDPVLRKAYAEEKLRIRTEIGARRTGYAEAKTDFIRSALSF